MTTLGGSGVPVYISNNRKVLGGAAIPVYIMGGSASATAIQGRAVSDDLPTDGQLLIWSASANEWLVADIVLLNANLSFGGYEVSNYGENSATATIAAGAVEFNAATANHWNVSLTENVTNITITWPANADNCSFSVKFTQDGVGGRTVSFVGYEATDGTAPTISTDIGAVSRVVFFTEDGGTTEVVAGIGSDYDTIT